MAAAVNECVRSAGAAGRNVRGRIAISLKFVVPEATVASVEGPVRAVDGTIQRAIKFVAPLGGPGYGAGVRRRSALRSGDDR